MSDKQVVTFEELKSVFGISYSRAHIWRLMEPTIIRSTGTKKPPKKGTWHQYKEWEEPNPNQFPQFFKLGPFRGSPVAW
jgi:predicted DNA-binding transcriptional regulator AlpA